VPTLIPSRVGYDFVENKFTLIGQQASVLWRTNKRYSCATEADSPHKLLEDLEQIPHSRVEYGTFFSGEFKT
jgi:hypothetical protein